MLLQRDGCFMLCAFFVAALLALASAEEAKEEMAEEKAAENTMQAVSWMLLGSITFQMSLFYLVNWPDVDIRYYSWMVIGNTISIFTAVLTFQSIQGAVEHLATDAHYGHEHEWDQLLIDFAHMMFWFVAVQVSLFLLCGKLTHKPFEDVPEAECTQEIREQQKDLRSKREGNLRCFAQMLAHITGFAAMRALGNVQHLSWFAASPLQSLIVVLLAYILLSFIFKGVNYVRDLVINADGGADEMEKLWQEQSLDAENDVIGLACSFVLLQSTRFALFGSLPDLDGTMEVALDGKLPNLGFMMYETWIFLALLVAFTTIAIVLFFLGHRFAVAEGLSDEDDEEDDHASMRDASIHRFLVMSQTVFFMCSSWCILFAGQAFSRAEAADQATTIVGKIALALVVSLFLFSIIFVLDKVADSDFITKETDVVLVKVIVSKGLAIGFAWEQCFDAAVDVVGGETPQAFTTKLLVAGFIVVLVVPAYRLYVLPKVDAAQAIKDAADDERFAEEKVAEESGLNMARSLQNKVCQLFGGSCTRPEGYRPLASK